MLHRPSLAVVCMCRSPRMSLQLDQLGQLSLQLAAVLAKFGWNERHAELGVDLGLFLAGDQLLALEQAVLVELVALLDGQFAKPDVVLLRAGEVLQGGTERLGRQDPQIDLDLAAFRTGDQDRALGIARCPHAADLRLVW